MLKEDVEKVLIKSFDYFKSILGSNIDIGELKELADFIVNEFEEEMVIEKQIQPNYVMSQYDLSQLIHAGKYSFKDIYGRSIELVYEDDSKTPFMLESGKMLIWDRSSTSPLRKNQISNNIVKNIRDRDKPRILEKLDEIFQEKKLKREHDFKSHLDKLDELIYLCIREGWDEKLEVLQKLRSKIMREEINQEIRSGKQRTLADFNN